MSATLDLTAKGTERSNIYTALHAVYQKVGYVQKDKPKAGGLNYSYASESSLIEALRPAMVEAGLIVHVERATVDHRDTYTNKQGTVMNRTCINATVRFTHAPSGTFVDVQALGEGIDAGDKSTPKALTGAYKYALREAFCIETGDDADKEPSAGQERVEHTRDGVTTLKGRNIPPLAGATAAASKTEDTPEAAARRRLWVVAQAKGMDETALKEYLSTDSLKALAQHMVGPKGDCDMPHPHGLPSEADAYRAFTSWLEASQ